MADPEELDNAITVPPEPAGPLKLTAPETLPPPITLVGLRLTERRLDAVMVRVAD